MDSVSNVSTPSGKWPQKITEWVQTLRAVLAMALARSVEAADGPDSSGCTT